MWRPLSCWLLFARAYIHQPIFHGGTLSGRRLLVLLHLDCFMPLSPTISRCGRLTKKWRVSILLRRRRCSPLLSLGSSGDSDMRMAVHVTPAILCHMRAYVTISHQIMWRNLQSGIGQAAHAFLPMDVGLSCWPNAVNRLSQ